MKCISHEAFVPLGGETKLLLQQTNCFPTMMTPLCCHDYCCVLEKKKKKHTNMALLPRNQLRLSLTCGKNILQLHFIGSLLSQLLSHTHKLACFLRVVCFILFFFSAMIVALLQRVLACARQAFMRHYSRCKALPSLVQVVGIARRHSK